MRFELAGWFHRHTSRRVCGDRPHLHLQEGRGGGVEVFERERMKGVTPFTPVGVLWIRRLPHGWDQRHVIRLPGLPCCWPEGVVEPSRRSRSFRDTSRAERHERGAPRRLGPCNLWGATASGSGGAGSVESDFHVDARNGGVREGQVGLQRKEHLDGGGSPCSTVMEPRCRSGTRTSEEVEHAPGWCTSHSYCLSDRTNTLWAISARTNTPVMKLSGDAFVDVGSNCERIWPWAYGRTSSAARRGDSLGNYRIESYNGSTWTPDAGAGTDIADRTEKAPRGCWRSSRVANLPSTGPP